MNRFKSLLAVFAFSLLVLGLPTFASAQWRDRDRDDDYYGRDRNRDRDNDNYGRNRNRNRDDDNYRRNRNRNRNDDYYGRNRGYNNGYLNSAVKRLKSNSRNFERRLDRELDRGGYGGRRGEDYLNRLAEDFKEAADRLEDRFDNGRNLGRSSNEARQVLNLGEQLERELHRARLSYNVQNDWNRIRQDLRVVSDAYGYNNRTYPNNRRDNRRGNTGTWRDRIPFPLPF